MRTITIVLVFATVLAAACSGPADEEPEPLAPAASSAAPPAEPPPVADAWPDFVGGLAFEPMRIGPSANPTSEERSAWKNAKGGGVLLAKVRDAATGEPVTACDSFAFKYALAKEMVDRHPAVRVRKRNSMPRSPDGIFRFPLGPGWYRLQLSSSTYRHTWTPVFEIRPGEETRLAILMKPANRIRVVVLDPDGKPISRGAVLLRSKSGLRASLVLTAGVGERHVDVDELIVEIGTVFLKEYAEQHVPVSLDPGGTTVVEIHLTRR